LGEEAGLHPQGDDAHGSFAFGRHVALDGGQGKKVGRRAGEQGSQARRRQRVQGVIEIGGRAPVALCFNGQDVLLDAGMDRCRLYLFILLPLHPRP
jgi:hypothetical protein